MQARSIRTILLKENTFDKRVKFKDSFDYFDTLDWKRRKKIKIRAVIFFLKFHHVTGFERFSGGGEKWETGKNMQILRQNILGETSNTFRPPVWVFFNGQLFLSFTSLAHVWSATVSWCLAIKLIWVLSDDSLTVCSPRYLQAVCA